MAKKPDLRAVQEGETKPATKPKTIAEAAKSGDELDVLMAMRDRIATAVDHPGTAARDLAALSRRLHEILRDIEAIKSRQGEDGIGEAASLPDAEFNASSL